VATVKLAGATVGFERIGSGSKATWGTGLQGYLPSDVSASALSGFFGRPDKGSDDGKVSRQWAFRFAGSGIATVYDWKGGRGFNIGGNSKLAVAAVYAALGLEAPPEAFVA